MAAAFRFRAEAALEVRRKEEDLARLVSATAEAAVAAAATECEEAHARVSAEGLRLAQTQEAGTEAWRLQWHRAWLESQRRDAEERERELAHRTADAARAADAVRTAMKRRRVLERLRDRAWHRYQRAAQRQHVGDMNELATLRFVAQMAETGGTHAD